MPIHIAKKAIEQSSFVVTIDWTDENGDAVTPTAMVWTLHDRDGRIINSREDVSIAVPAATESVFISGDDLAVHGNSPITRYMLFEGTYTSAVHGAGKPLRDQVSFDIIPLILI